MARRRSEPKPKRPQTAFGWCTINIQAAFKQLTALVDNNFWPSTLQYEALETLLVRPEHVTILRQARELLGPTNTSQRISLPVWSDSKHGDVDHPLVPAYVEFKAEVIGRIAWPLYALDGSQQALLNESELYQKLRAELLLWHEMRSRVMIARRVFNDLDNEPDVYKPRHIRYLMPSLLTLLRTGLAITQKNWDDEKDTMLKQFRQHLLTLQEADPAGYTTLPNTVYDFRTALALANETVASVTLLTYKERDRSNLQVGVNTWQVTRWFVPEIDYCFRND